MSGVYIPNWEKPKSCDDCWAEYAYEICNSHSDSCPLVSVPDHGRLIDADEFEKFECNACDGACDVVGCDCTNCDKDCRCDFMLDLHNAPTIIPADKETPCEDCPYDKCSIPEIGSCEVADKDGVE